MSSWRKCDTCRKVRPLAEFDGGTSTCQPCLTAPAPSATPRKRSTAVTRTQTAPRPPAAEPGPRAPLLGSIGSGDLEVRERRARRAANEALTESHPEEFALLLRDARAKEGLRPMAVETPAAEGNEEADRAIETPADGSSGPPSAP